MDNLEKRRAQNVARQARHKERLAAQGIKQLVILAPIDLHEKIKKAASEIIENHAR
ncbi:MAG: hypothetical protein H5T98_00770 [Syntrophomonadaceae bacterium]|nr:hypothetical protein [Syntrophomonadaceae bacterium]